MQEFEEIYRENFTKVYSFILRLCADAYLAEELTQETFFQAFRSFRRFRGDCEIFTWLAAIAKHSYYKHLRRKRQGLESLSLDALTEAYCFNFGGTPEDSLVKQSVIDAVRRMIDKIPPKYKDVVILRVYGELPFSQVAKALEISESSAKVIFFRAKKMLMEEMKNEFEL